jgi:hypothetical protein
VLFDKPVGCLTSIAFFRTKAGFSLQKCDFYVTKIAAADPKAIRVRCSVANTEFIVTKLKITDK